MLIESFLIKKNASILLASKRRSAVFVNRGRVHSSASRPLDSDTVSV